MESQEVQVAMLEMEETRNSTQTIAALKGSQEMQLVSTSMNAIKALLRACTRIPNGTKKEFDKALYYIEEAAQSLEAKLNYVSAERDLLRNSQSPQQNGYRRSNQEREEHRQKSTTAKKFAEAVKDANITLIIKPLEDRTPEQLREQLQQGFQ